MTLRILWMHLAILIALIGASVPVHADMDTASRGRVRMDAAVDGDLLFDAERIEIFNSVSGNFDGHGKVVLIGPNGAVKGTTRIKADLVTIDGHLATSEIEAREVTLNGRLDGPTRIAADTIVFSNKVHVTGDVTYVSPTEARIEDGARIDGSLIRVTRLGDTIVVQSTHTKPYWLIWLFGLGAALIVWCWPDLVGEARVAFDRAIGHSLRDGLVVLLVPPVVIAIFAVSLFGLPFAAIFALFYAALLIVAISLAIIIFGDWLLLSFGRPIAHPLAGRLLASLCGSIFLWLMMWLMGALALVLAAALGLGVIAAMTETILAPGPGLRPEYAR